MLVTLNELKIYLGIDLTDTTQDAYLTQQIQAVSEAIEGYCHRKFAAKDYIQTIYPEDFGRQPIRQLALYSYPLISLSEINDIPVTDQSFPYLRVHKPSAIITGFSSDAPGFYNSFWGYRTTLKFRAGYEVIPAAIKQVVFSLVGDAYNSKLSAGSDMNFGANVKGVSIPGVMNIQYDVSNLNDDEESAYGIILKSQVSVLHAYRSNRAVLGDVRLEYAEEV